MLMWLLDLIPTWLIAGTFVAGVVGFLIGNFGTMLPFVAPYARVIKLASAAAVVVSIFLVGAAVGSAEWRAALVEAEHKAEQVKVESQAANAQLASKIEEQQKKLKEKQRVRTEYITNVVTKYDDRCDVSNAAVSVLRSAAENGVPPSTSSTDGATSDVKISDIVQNTSDNYATCYEIRDKLIGWQDWYTEQLKIYNKK